MFCVVVWDKLDCEPWILAWGKSLDLAMPKFSLAATRLAAADWSPGSLPQAACKVSFKLCAKTDPGTPDNKRPKAKTANICRAEFLTGP